MLKNEWYSYLVEILLHFRLMVLFAKSILVYKGYQQDRVV